MSVPSTDYARPNAVVMVISAMLTALVVIVFARLAYGLILPTMRADLAMSYRQAGNLGTVTALAYLLFVLPGGALAARWGARKTILLGLLLDAIGFIGLATSSLYALVVVEMFLLGLGTAFCFAPMLSLLATWYPLRRGLVIGFMTTGVGSGLLLSGLLVPWLTQTFGQPGWRLAWAVFAAVTIVVMVLVLTGVKDPPALHHGDVPAPSAADKWRIYRSGRVIIIGVVYGIIGLAYIVQGLFMVSFAEQSGVSTTTAGLLFSMYGLVSVTVGPLWGLLSDIWGRANALLLSMFLVTLGMALPLFAQTLPIFFCHFLLMGCAINGAFTMVQAGSTDQVAPRHIPIAFSYVTVFFAGGQFLGPAVAGWLIQASGFKAAVGFTCVILLIGLYLSYRVRKFPSQVAVE